MTRARTLADLGSASLATDAEATAAASAAAAAVPTGAKNLLYNGAMQVAQRGTSASGKSVAGYYTADRWYLGPTNLGTWTMSIESDGPSGSGLSKSVKALCTTADASPASADEMFVSQSLEGQDLQRVAKGSAGAQQLTMSFWVKSNVTGTYIVWLYDNDNNRHVAGSYTVAASATWEQKSITFPADTTGAWDNDNAASLLIRWYLGAGSNYTSGTLATSWASLTNANRAVGQTNLAAAVNNYWQITGVQLEVGDAATEFEHKPYGAELAECQRYYHKVIAGNYELHGAWYSASSAIMWGYHPTVMRANPTVITPTTTSVEQPGFAFRPATFGATQTSHTGMRINVSGATGSTAGHAAVWAGTAIQISAEL